MPHDLFDGMHQHVCDMGVALSKVTCQGLEAHKYRNCEAVRYASWGCLELEDRNIQIKRLPSMYRLVQHLGLTGRARLAEGHSALPAKLLLMG